MPPSYSRPEKADRSANAGSTPRGHRTPRGQRPQHTPRGGRSDFSDRRQTDNDDSQKEIRTRGIEDAFNASIHQIRINNVCFVQCILQVLRRQAGVQTERDHDDALQDRWLEKGSRHLSYLFRHTKLTHEDGSVSLNEMLSHGEAARKIRGMNKKGHERLQPHQYRRSPGSTPWKEQHHPFSYAIGPCYLRFQQVTCNDWFSYC